MRRTPPEIETYVIDSYKNGMSLSAIAEEFGHNGRPISPVTCKNILDRYGIPLRTKGGIQPLPFEKIAQEYHSPGTTLSGLATQYGVSVNTIKNAVKKAGNYPANKRSTDVFLAEDYFEDIATEKQAYILGYLIADGNVCRYDGRYTVRIMVKKDDISICELIKSETHSSNQIITSKRKSGSEVCFALNSSKMCSDLEKYGIVPAKTGKTFLPTLDANLMPHLIRGLIDGDGWTAKFTRTSKNSVSYAIGLCGDCRLVADVRDYLVKHLGVYKVCVLERNNGTWSQIVWGSKNDVQKISRFIYQDAQVFLPRKRNKIQELL